MISRICVCCILFPLFITAQTLTGKVIDKATQLPIETVSIYFDTTTLGTTTDENGVFSIAYTGAIQSTLVFSYLGYEKVFISEFRNQDNITIELVEATNTLDEVYIDYDDGLTRKQKLRLFRKAFLGSSKFARSCEILNEDDLILRYNKQDRSLTASAKREILVQNKALKYEISYDIIDFELGFGYVDMSTNEFVTKSVIYLGTSFFKDQETTNKKKTLKNRQKAYSGSVQHFIRALYEKNLEDHKYWVFSGKFKVDAWDYFKVEALENSVYKRVTLSKKITILYDKDLQSGMELKIPEMFIDNYGNFTPILGVYFSGFMGSQRIGDTLPLDYGLDN